MKIFLIMKLTFFIVLLDLIMGQSVENLAIKLDTWMRDLPQYLKDLPLTSLAIPGSHDSMTFGISAANGLAPDADSVLRTVKIFFPHALERWSTNQKLDTMQQLLIGIRYLDLRMATKTGTDEIFFTHGLYAEEISRPLSHVKEFVDTHPGEVVILDCQHFYGFTDSDHVRLIRYFLELFGPRLVPRLFFTKITLNSLARVNQSIIIVYRHHAVQTTNMLWPTSSIVNPWPQQETATGLLRYFQSVYRPPGVGFVHQVVLTPTASFIILRATSSIREKCAKPALREVLPVVESYFTPGQVTWENEKKRPAPINVVIADYVDLENNLFPRTIIAMNNKLIPKHYTNY